MFELISEWFSSSVKAIDLFFFSKTYFINSLQFFFLPWIFGLALGGVFAYIFTSARNFNHKHIVIGFIGYAILVLIAVLLFKQ